jgi:hypothetical protein
MLGVLLLLFALNSILLPSSGLASDTEQLLRIEKVIELDREKLAELKSDISQRQEFFDQLADRTRMLKRNLAGSKARLEEMASAGTPPCCVSEHSGSQALQLQRLESAGHLRVAPPSRRRLPIRSKWKLSALDRPTTTESKKPSAKPAIGISFRSWK